MIDLTVEQTTQDGDHAIQQFEENYPDTGNVGQFYDGLSPEGYDEWAKRVNFNEPYFIIKEVEKIANNVEIPTVTKQSALLDVGAGTGLIGSKLSASGFDNMVACDASDRFMRAVSRLPYYTEARTLWLGRGVELFPEEFRDQFDLVTASGVFLRGHMPKEAIDDIHAALKTGGYFVTAMRSIYWQNGQAEGYKDKLDGLIAEGKFKLVQTDLHEGQNGRGRPLRPDGVHTARLAAL